MQNQIINLIVNAIVTGLLGYCVKGIKDYKKKSKAENKALLIMLQTNLTNTFFVYEREKKIPDYIYKNWLNELVVYEDLGGDDYIHILAEKMKSWEIVHTGILSN